MNNQPGWTAATVQLHQLPVDCRMAVICLMASIEHVSVRRTKRSIITAIVMQLPAPLIQYHHPPEPSTIMIMKFNYIYIKTHEHAWPSYGDNAKAAGFDWALVVLKCILQCADGVLYGIFVIKTMFRPHGLIERFVDGTNKDFITQRLWYAKDLFNYHYIYIVIMRF